MTEMRECNITIGGEGVVCLTTPINNSNKPKFTRAQILPGRGFMVLQIGAYIPGIGEINVLEAPQVPEAARVLDAGGADDYGGIKSFRFGAAVLIPYSNRIRGTQSG